MAIKDIVNVQIELKTTAVAEQGFGTVMILGTHKVFNERIRFYQTIDSIIEDGFDTNSKEYIAANAAFAQIPQPTFVAIGRRNADVSNVTITNAVTNYQYSIKINNTNFTYTADADDLVTDIASSLVSIINAGTEAVTASNTLGVITLTADIPSTAYSVIISKNNMSINATANLDIEDDLQAIEDENNDWYGLVITSRASNDILATALWAESRIKLFGSANDELESISANPTSGIAYELNRAAYARSFTIYHTDADNIYPEAAWFGKMLPMEPGVDTWAFKQLATIPFVNLSDTQRLNAFNNNVNTYERRGGVNITLKGKVAANEWIDLIIGRDWLQARITESVYSLLINNRVPYTDSGIAKVEAVLRNVLVIARNVGFLTDDPENQFVIITPKRRDVPFNDVANRILRGLKFTAVPASSIQQIEIFGTLTYQIQ